MARRGPRGRDVDKLRALLLVKHGALTNDGSLCSAPTSGSQERQANRKWRGPRHVQERRQDCARRGGTAFCERGKAVGNSLEIKSCPFQNCANAICPQRS